MNTFTVDSTPAGPAVRGTKAERSCLRAVIDQHDAQGWDELCQHFPANSLYQTWAFGETHGTGSFRAVSRFALLRGEVPIVVAQFRIKKLPFLRAGVADAEWGPLCEPDTWSDAEIIDQFFREISREYLQRRSLQVRFTPRGDLNAAVITRMSEAFSASGFRKSSDFREYRTIVLDLQQELGSLRRKLHPKWRNSLVASEKAQFSIVQGSDAHHFTRFKQLYDAMWAAKRFPTGVRIDFVEKLFKEFEGQHPLTVVLVEDQGQDVAGGVFGVAGNTALYYLGASAPGAGDGKSPGYFLHWQVIQYLKNAGMHWYDLGGLLDQPDSGVDRFKNRTNGQRLVFPGRFEATPSGSRWLLFRTAEALYGKLRLRAQQLRPSPRS